MRHIYVHTIVIYMTFFVMLCHPFAVSASVRACVEKVCVQNSTQITFKDFEIISESKHPQLSKFYGKYKKSIHRIRKQQKARTESILKKFNSETAIINAVSELDKTDLLLLFLDIAPWNTDSTVLNGEFEVEIEALSQEPEVAAVIESIVSRFRESSVLYELYLKNKELSMPASELINSEGRNNVKDFVGAKINESIMVLPESEQNIILIKRNKFLAGADIYSSLIGDGIYFSMWTLEIEAKMRSGKFQISQREAKVLKRYFNSIFIDLHEGNKGKESVIRSMYSKKRWSQTCKASYNKALHFGLSDEVSKTNLNWIRTESLSKANRAVNEIFSKSMATKLITYLQGIHINAPMSLEEYEQYIQIGISGDSESFELELKQFNDISNTISSEKDILLSNICNSDMYIPFLDNADVNYIGLSVFSMRNFDTGLGIVLHEFAHALSAELTRLNNKGFSVYPFENIRECINKNYVNSKRPPRSSNYNFAGDTLWTEEDWGDAFAGYALRDLRINSKCSALDWFPERDYLSLNNRTIDTHSPTFYRILNINAHRGGELPLQCKAELNEKFDQVSFEDCITPYLHGNQ